MIRLFTNTIAIKILIALGKSSREKYYLQLSREIESTYAHVKKVVDRLEEEGMVTCHKEGREVFIKLTEKGYRITKQLIEINKILETW